MAGKKEEEDEEKNLNNETELRMKALKDNMSHDQSGINAAILNVLENYNGIITHSLSIYLSIYLSISLFFSFF